MPVLPLGSIAFLRCQSGLRWCQPSWRMPSDLIGLEATDDCDRLGQRLAQSSPAPSFQSGSGRVSLTGRSEIVQLFPPSQMSLAGRDSAAQRVPPAVSRPVREPRDQRIRPGIGHRRLRTSGHLTPAKRHECWPSVALAANSTPGSAVWKVMALAAHPLQPGCVRAGPRTRLGDEPRDLGRRA